MLTAVIYDCPNCPVHDAWYFSRLEWFVDENAMLEWLRDNTKTANFIREGVWDADTHKKTDYEIKYLNAGHAYVGVEVFKAGVKIAHVKQHPYGDDKPWVIEKAENEYE